MMEVFTWWVFRNTSIEPQNVRRWCRALATLLFLSAVLPADTLKLIRKIPHSGYSEGLEYHEGYLWNALPKNIVKIDPKDGTVVAKFSPATEYSESVTWFQGQLWNLSFHDNGIYAGKLMKDNLKFEKRGTTPEVHGWGITHNNKELIITGDYSSKVYFLNPKTLAVTKTVEAKAKDLEDLAWDGRYLWTSSFTTFRGQIFRVDSRTGKLKGVFRLPNPEECPIIDGIAVQGNQLWVTGKECPSLYLFQKPR